MTDEQRLAPAQLRQAFDELMEKGMVRPGSLVVLGCSTSEVVGATIGKHIQPQLGLMLAQAALEAAAAHGVSLAVQCCEHLNRALVVERDTAVRLGLKQVTAIPHPSAGGSCAAAAFRQMQDAVLVESVQADAGLDIGDTFIGMQLRPVVVPVRVSLNRIGQAHLTLATTRPPYIGGPRARYVLEETEA